MKHQEFIQEIHQMVQLLEKNQYQIERSQYKAEYLNVLGDLWLVSEDIHESLFNRVNNKCTI